jgi:hypothetical protein
MGFWSAVEICDNGSDLGDWDSIPGPNIQNLAKCGIFIHCPQQSVGNIFDEDKVS